MAEVGLPFSLVCLENQNEVETPLKNQWRNKEQRENGWVTYSNITLVVCIVPSVPEIKPPKFHPEKKKCLNNLGQEKLHIPLGFFIYPSLHHTTPQLPLLLIPNLNYNLVPKANR